MRNLPARRVVEGEVFRPDVRELRPFGISIEVTGLPVVIEAEFRVVRGGLPAPLSVVEECPVILLDDQL